MKAKTKIDVLRKQIDRVCEELEEVYFNIDEYIAREQPDIVAEYETRATQLERVLKVKERRLRLEKEFIHG